MYRSHELCPVLDLRAPRKQCNPAVLLECPAKSERVSKPHPWPRGQVKVGVTRSQESNRKVTVWEFHRIRHILDPRLRRALGVFFSPPILRYFPEA